MRHKDPCYKMTEPPVGASTWASGGCLCGAEPEVVQQLKVKPHEFEPRAGPDEAVMRLAETQGAQVRFFPRRAS
jgi:hypothetical protein